jgi:hypothetical protein
VGLIAVEVVLYGDARQALREQALREQALGEQAPADAGFGVAASGDVAAPGGQTAPGGEAAARRS